MDNDQIKRTIEYYEGCEPTGITIATNIITYANGERDYEYDTIYNCQECEDRDCPYWREYNDIEDEIENDE